MDMHADRPVAQPVWLFDAPQLDQALATYEARFARDGTPADQLRLWREAVVHFLHSAEARALTCGTVAGTAPLIK